MRTIIAALAVVFSSGCAFTVHDVDVDYKYAAPEGTTVPVIGSAPQIEVGEFTDSRNVANPRMIMNMTNMNGDTTSGGWQAEKPLNEILQDAVSQGLDAAGIPSADGSAPLEMSGELLEFKDEVIMGFWEGSYTGKLTVKFQLLDKGTGDITWRDTFVGTAEVKGKEGAVGLFKATLDDLITDLLTDRYFLQQLRGATDGP